MWELMEMAYSRSKKEPASKLVKNKRKTNWYPRKKESGLEKISEGMAPNKNRNHSERLTKENSRQNNRSVSKPSLERFHGNNIQ